MIEADRFALRFVGALGVVMLLCCLPLVHGRAAGQARQQGDEFNIAGCTNFPLTNTDEIDLNAVASTIDAAIRARKNWIPCDAIQESNPKQTTGAARRLQHGFDYYSWLTFLALNSPENGFIGNGPPAWETYKQLPDVMLSDGSEPSDWKDGVPNEPVVPAECGNKKGMVIHMEMEETYNQPFKTGPLIDQNGNYAVFVIFMNKVMFKYIQNPQHPLYNREGQANFQREVDFPGGDIGGNQLGTIMIKASWKLMRPGVDFGWKISPKDEQYHMIDALLYRPKQHREEACRAVKLGLIGFHVGHKTDTRQQWIWTTFEHKLNVPTQQNVDTKQFPQSAYSFYQIGCDESQCPTNQTPEGSWDPDTLGWTPFPRSPKFKSQKFKSQIERMGPPIDFHDGDQRTLQEDIKSLNDKFHQWPRIKDTVWKNYDLIMTQWPSGFPCAGLSHPGNLPDPTCTPFPTYLANSTLETFSQPLHDGGVPLATSSCISCHNNATTKPPQNSKTTAMRSDFTYILEKAQSNTAASAQKGSRK
jgi:hypothetical protein